jgi:pyruvate dehydrogenase E2 component (dihydrolipoamide acetyltransferase)
MRKVIAERMSMSWQNAPHVNMTTEVDMTSATALKEKLTKASGRNISFTDIIVKCVAQTLQEFPVVNASLIEGKIVSHNHVNVGIAVALENGLIVPVVKHANFKTIANIREEIFSLSDKARNGGLSADELSQGTFTVTNLGMFGVDHFTPIINPPESAILGVCRIVERPVVKCGEVVIKPMMNLCLSFDHRLVDGAVGAQYLARLRQLLEEPLLLL